MSDQEQCEKRYRNLTVHGNPKEGQTLEVAACGYICTGCFRESFREPQNRESVMSGPEITIVTSNVRVI